ncbi:MAG: NADH-quinone oxidoreductase subunit N [bacterium]
MSNPFTSIDFLSILPETILIVMGMVVVVIELFGTGRDTRNLAYLALLSLATAALADVFLLGRNLEGFFGSVAADDFSIAFELIILLATALTVLLSVGYLEDRDMHHGEYYSLLLFAATGAMFLVSGMDLLIIFIGLEILSISSYILCGMIQHDPRSNESALKYFLLGAFSTGFLLYGIALLYGATGSIHLRAIRAAFEQPDAFANPYFAFGLGFILVGFGFKIALVPFHMWTPDVYEGAPTTITAFLSTGPKAAGFAALIRILFEGMAPAQAEWSQVLWLLAAVTMTVGNVVALQQDNIKRMLAYSSIAHAGYILVALVAGGAEGLAAVVFYTLAYTLMTFGAFGVLILASDKERERVTFADYAGYAYLSPVLAAAMFLFMLSLAGIPLTAGFAGKFQIFKTVIERGFYWLAVIGVLNSVVSLYYYLRLVVVMYMQPATAQSIDRPAQPSVPLYLAIAAAFFGVLYLGIFPSEWIELSLRSVSTLVAGG